MHRVAFPGPGPSAGAGARRSIVDTPAAQSAASAALAHLNYAAYMYYLGIAALAQARLAQSAYPAPGHARVHSTASNTSLRSLASASSLDTPTTALFTAGASAGEADWVAAAARGVRTPDTCCSDIVSDDDGTGCPLADLPTSCASTPLEARAAELSALAAAAALRKPSQASIYAADDDGLPLAARYPLSAYNRMASPFGDGAWWACVTHEKPWGPLPLPAKMDPRRLPKLNTRVQHVRGSRRRAQVSAVLPSMK